MGEDSEVKEEKKIRVMLVYYISCTAGNPFIKECQYELLGF